MRRGRAVDQQYRRADLSHHGGDDRMDRRDIGHDDGGIGEGGCGGHGGHGQGGKFSVHQGPSSELLDRA